MGRRLKDHVVGRLGSCQRQELSRGQISVCIDNEVILSIGHARGLELVEAVAHRPRDEARDAGVPGGGWGVEPCGYPWNARGADLALAFACHVCRLRLTHGSGREPASV